VARAWLWITISQNRLLGQAIDGVQEKRTLRYWGDNLAQGRSHQVKTAPTDFAGNHAGQRQYRLSRRL
jgi:hypothetical protein